MAENSKGGILAKAQKRLSRTKTKVLQNLGKAERTTDESLDECAHLIDRQQEVAHKVQKDLRHYIQCARALSCASKTFFTTVSEIYEPNWTQESTFKQSLESFDALWEDYLDNLNTRIVTPVNEYLTSFPTIKAKISKRGRKLMDYDNARHNLDVQQNAKKKDEAKITKAQEELTEAKLIYDDMNNLLHRELPEFYNSRVTFYSNIFQSLFSSKNTFHGNTAQLADKLTDISTQLSKDFSQFVYRPTRPVSKSSDSGEENPIVNGNQQQDTPPTPKSEKTDEPSVSKEPDSPAIVTKSVIKENGDYYAPEDVIGENTQGDVYTNQSTIIAQKSETGTMEDDKQETTQVNGISGAAQTTEEVKEKNPLDLPDYPPPAPPGDEEQTTVASRIESVYDEPKSSRLVVDDDDDDDDDHYQMPMSNKPLRDLIPDNFLYEVQATHMYQGEDEDELTFEAEEIIYVIPHENPDEQDDGWVMGIKKSNGQKGVFPENFTKRV
ncbi:amphiphysin-like [Gigantopelta aegis]|uniref:amphiphysin-like n=1 Tax=Gigantopelta aegis TaxID=1735272 RepID=UPI001B887A2F|nr:amphiphysin-like [Gigantopelta aegis]